MRQIPLAVQSAQGHVIKNNPQLMINMYAVKGDLGAKDQYYLINTPGLKTWATLPTYPILGMSTFKNYLYVATSTRIYKVDNIGTITDLGTVDFSNANKVYFSWNGTDIITTGKNTYSINYLTDTVTLLTGGSVYTADTNCFLDGYFILNRNDTGQFFISGYYNTTFNALDYATAEGSPDELLGVYSDKRKLWLMGSNSIEVWYNSGGLFPFNRISGTFGEIGIKDHRSVSKVRDTLAWVGSDGVVYLANGYSRQKISNEYVEKELGDNNYANIESLSYTIEGHNFYCITVNNKVTMCYDLDTGLWHTRESKDINRWRIKDVETFNNKNYACDYQNGIIYLLDDNTYKEGDNEIIREIISTPIKKNNERFTVNKIYVDLEMGETGDDDIIYLQYSEDGGISWSNIKESYLGATGERTKRAIWRRLGRHRNFVMKLITWTDKPFKILGGYGDFK